MKESKNFKMIYDNEEGLYFLSNGIRKIGGGEVQSAARKMETRGGKKWSWFHSPLYGHIHVRVLRIGRTCSIPFPRA